jgi:hypothetical protein
VSGLIDGTIMERLWDRLDEMYPGTFLAQYGTKAKAWMDEFNRQNLTVQDIARGLAALEDQGGKYPPSRPEFLKMCKPVSAPYHQPYQPKLPERPATDRETARRHLAEFKKHLQGK